MFFQVLEYNYHLYKRMIPPQMVGSFQSWWILIGMIGNKIIIASVRIHPKNWACP